MLLLGVTFFIKYSVDQGWIGPAARVVLAGVFGLALIAGGELGVRRGIRPAADGLIAYRVHRSQLEDLKKDDGKLLKEAKAKADEAAKAVEEAEAKAKAAPEADKDAADKAVAEAKDVKADKDAAAAALEKRQADLQALVDKQTAKELEDKEKAKKSVTHS